jgi:hypothetical protein
MLYSNIIHYIAIVAWAKKRYTINDTLIIQRNNNFSSYAMIESLAWKKYML